MNSREIAFRTISKYLLLSVIAFLLYILQATPGFLQIGEIKPVFLISFCLNLAILDEEMYTLWVYVVAGLLFELSAGRIIGLYTIPLVIICTVTTMSVKYFIKPTIRNGCIFSIIAMLVIFSVDFLFNYILMGYDNLGTIYLKTIIFSSIYSFLFSPICYKIIVGINNRFKRFDAR